jgi:hypothetical protein
MQMAGGMFSKTRISFLPSARRPSLAAASLSPRMATARQTEDARREAD